MGVKNEPGPRQEEVKERWGREGGKDKVVLFSVRAQNVLEFQKKIQVSLKIQPESRV